MNGDQRVSIIAASQLGVVSLEQARRAGLTNRQIAHRIECGRWLRLHRHVVAIAGSPNSWRRDAVAAVLASPGAGTSHTTAGRIHRFTYLPPPKGHIHILRPHSHNHRLDGVVIHQTRLLPAEHLTVVDGIAVTTPERTTIDLAAMLGAARFGRLVDDQLAAGRIDLLALEQAFAVLARRGRPGIQLVAKVIGERQGNYVPPASELEARFATLCASAGLPEPVRQLRLPWAPDDGDRSGRVDVGFEPQRVIVELDSWRHHSSMAAFEQDRRRDQLATAAGWRPLRFTWRQLNDDPAHVLAVLAAVLET